jgi:small subunit ribosomal protein S21
LAEVRLQDGESLESALKRFKRKVLQEGIIADIKRHAFYLKPGQKKRVKQALARKRDRKKNRRDSEPDRNPSGRNADLHARAAILD